MVDGMTWQDVVYAATVELLNQTDASLRALATLLRAVVSHLLRHALSMRARRT